MSRALPGPHSWWLLIVHQVGSYPSRPQNLLGCWARALIGETPPPEPDRSMWAISPRVTFTTVNIHTAEAAEEPVGM